MVAEHELQQEQGVDDSVNVVVNTDDENEEEYESRKIRELKEIVKKLKIVKKQKKDCVPCQKKKERVG